MNYRMEAGTEPHACDVCRLLYRDAATKSDARYCNLCDAWLCDHCRSRWTSRAIAAILHAGELLKGRLNGNDSSVS